MKESQGKCRTTKLASKPPSSARHGNIWPRRTERPGKMGEGGVFQRKQLGEVKPIKVDDETEKKSRFS